VSIGRRKGCRGWSRTRRLELVQTRAALRSDTLAVVGPLAVVSASPHTVDRAQHRRRDGRRWCGCAIRGCRAPGRCAASTPTGAWAHSSNPGGPATASTEHRAQSSNLNPGSVSSAWRPSPTHRPREDGLAHPADTSRSNIASTLGWRLTVESSGAAPPHRRAPSERFARY
jgi:hypothetical protein